MDTLPTRWAFRAFGEGSTYEEALADVRSAIRFHVETFGAATLEPESPVLEAFIAEASL